MLSNPKGIKQRVFLLEKDYKDISFKVDKVNVDFYDVKPNNVLFLNTNNEYTNNSIRRLSNPQVNDFSLNLDRSDYYNFFDTAINVFQNYLLEGDGKFVIEGEFSPNFEKFLSITPSSDTGASDRLVVTDNGWAEDGVHTIGLTFIADETLGGCYIYFRGEGLGTEDNDIKIVMNAALNADEGVVGKRGNLLINFRNSITKFSDIDIASFQSKVVHLVLEVDLPNSIVNAYINGEYIDTIQIKSTPFGKRSTYLYGYGNKVSWGGKGLLISNYVRSCDTFNPIQVYTALKNMTIFSFTPTKHIRDNLNAKSVSVSTVQDGKLISIFNKYSASEVLPASLVKILCAILVIEYCENNSINMDSYKVTRKSSDNSSGSGANIEIGESINLTDAVDNLMLPSSNVTANMLAREFGTLMMLDNGQTPANDSEAVNYFVNVGYKSIVDKLQLRSTVFYSASGLDASSKSTAQDFQKIMSYAMSFNTLMLSWKKHKSIIKVYGDNDSVREVEITHSAYDYLKDNYIGCKTGTMANMAYNVCSIYMTEHNKPLIITILGSDSAVARQQDIKLILDNFKHFN